MFSRIDQLVQYRYIKLKFLKSSIYGKNYNDSGRHYIIKKIYLTKTLLIGIETGSANRNI